MGMKARKRARTASPTGRAKAASPTGRVPRTKQKSGRRTKKIVPLHETIRREIIKVLRLTTSIRQAAMALQMPYSSFRDKLDQYGIDIPGRKSSRHRSAPAFSRKSESGGG